MKPHADQPANGPGARPWGKRMLRLAGFAAVGYLGALVVLMALEKHMLFHPHRPQVGWERPPDGRTQDVTLASADGNTLHAWWCPTEGWEPEHGALLYCHGN